MRSWCAACALVIVLGSAVRARAWMLSVEGCDDTAVRDGIALELGATLDDDPFHRIEIACRDASDARVVVTATELDLVLEHRVALATIPPHLHARTLALVVGAMVESARAVEASPQRPEPPPVEPTIAAAPPPAVARMPLELAPVPVAPAPHGPSDVSLRAGGRVYPLDTATALGGVRVAVAYDWLDVELSVEATSARNILADAESVLALASIGARPLALRERVVSLSLGVHLEGGVSWTDTRPRLEGWVGRTSTNAVGGGFVRALVGLALDRWLDLRLAIDVGVDFGPVIVTSDARLLDVAGLFVGATLGVAVPGIP
ncbi:hypothetical protein [Sandaracinus amylolyticus]|uniref:Uncharacterized protein n=1 Tax=Sandaracinus amylolyticus TaxID=927083 RepID=A0A0F6W765_9BACT|nr:hypothetical protein [Sandaracinus amylolyticus]AKF09040.1 hypothetical protein DB32_006189 [Sandaracinus amylolyticus]